MSVAGPVWRTENFCGLLKCGPLEALAECDPDGAAFIPTKWNGQEVSGIEVLGGIGRALLQIAELYVRGPDLVANCALAGPDQIAPQLYWQARLAQGDAVAQIELMLSVRTELLDSSPNWSTSSFVPDSKIFHTSNLSDSRFQEISGESCSFRGDESSEHLFLFRCPSLGLSYAEMVHPSDFVSATTTTIANQPSLVCSQLFPERLEKGVIRRARICGWFMPAEKDLETAVELARRFVNEPLPLTA